MVNRKAAALLALLMSAVIVATSCAPAKAPTGTSGAPKIGAVSVAGVWGSTELSSFNKVVAGWQTQTGGKVNFESTRDLSALLTARVQGGNPPDLAIVPNPALMKQFAQQGKLQSLDGVLDMNKLKADYTTGWIDQTSVNGKVYGLVVKGSSKSTVWYDPKQFTANGYQIPKSWNELLALSDKIKSKGKAPWSIGVESGGASGWPGSDWIQEILLSESGPDTYDKWVAHQIPWTDPQVKSAFQKFGRVALTKGYVPGGTAAILSTNFQDASFLPFQTPPKAYMYFLGDFTEGFITAQFPKLKPLQDFDFFKFPPVGTVDTDTATGGGDTMVMFKDTPSSRSLMQYLQEGSVWEPWAKAGGYTTPNKSLNTSAYPDPIAVKAAAQLTQTTVFRFDADDDMPAEVQNAEWKAILDYLQNPGNLDKDLAQVESVAKTAYAKK